MRFASRFILAPHPKTEIRPTRDAIERVLRSGWTGQVKIHGHRAQIHIHADEKIPAIAFTRQGTTHKLALPPEISSELRRIVQPQEGWTAVDGEWLKPKKHFYLFDLLKQDGKELDHLTYPERYGQLNRNFISPHITLLPLLTTVEKCLQVLEQSDEHVEGLVFKSLSTPGFSDTSILRCRKRS